MLHAGQRRVVFVICLFCLISVTGANCWANEVANKQSEDLYSALERFHGHVCAGSLMGVRLGLAAKAALERTGIQGKLKAHYFSHSCPVDGIQVAAGTTYGNRAIEVQDKNEHRLLLADDKTGRQVEARITPRGTEKALSTRELNKRAKALPAGSSERKKLEQDIETIYIWLRSAPETEVVTVKVIR